MERPRRMEGDLPRVLAVVRAVSMGGMLAAVGYAFFVGPLAVLGLVAAPLALLTLLASVLHRGFGGRALKGEPPRWVVVLWWVAGCAVGGFVGGLGHVTEFFGELVLFGGVLGVAQWVVLRTYFRWSGGWVALSFFGWIAGQVTQISVQGVFPGAVQTVLEATGNELLGYRLFEPLTWMVFGFAQGVVFLILLGRGALPLVVLWVVASASGGALDAAMIYLGIYSLGGSLGGVVGEIGAVGIRQGVLCALYGIPTGLLLAGLVRLSRTVGEEA